MQLTLEDNTDKLNQTNLLDEFLKQPERKAAHK